MKPEMSADRRRPLSQGFSLKKKMGGVGSPGDEVGPQFGPMYGGS